MPTTRGDGRVELHYVDSGPRNAEAIILIHGLGQQLVQWDVIGLTNRLLESGRRVVAYDQRDCGLSMRFETTEMPSIGELQIRRERGQPVSLPYGLEDMADDVFRVMDACGVESGTVVGHSLGGVVAVLAALSRPDRFEGLVTISASLDNTARLGPRPLGSMPVVEEMCTPQYMPEFTFESVQWLQWVQSSPAFPMPSDVAAEAARLMVERGYDAAGNLRHFAAFCAADIRPERLTELAVDTVVIHGSEDPLLPLNHAKDLVAKIPGAELRVYHGAGHIMTPALVPELVADLLSLSGRGGAGGCKA